MGDWLGTGNTAPRYKIYRPFQEARKFARSLGFKSRAEWSAWAKTDKKPDDMSASPWKTYKNMGWSGMGDWLGTGNTANKDKAFLHFEKAREFIQSIGLRSHREFKEWRKSSKRPYNIPSNPNRTYKNKGWVDWPDWFGTKDT